jgi:hypothetical protein
MERNLKSESPQFPDDENGSVLRRMLDNGDDLSQPRIIDFYFTFSQRRQALVFADIVDERDVEIYISYDEESEMWEVCVKRHMVPTHEHITALELALTRRAESVGGEADGWGCVQVNRRD